MSRPEAPRTNARTFPSGENAGVESPIDPTGGVVSWRFSRLSSESKKMLLGSGGESCPEKAKYLPSGDQEPIVKRWWRLMNYGLSLARYRNYLWGGFE